MSTTYVVFAEQSEAAPQFLGVAHSVKGAREIGDEHLEEKRGATDYLTGDDVSAVTRGTPVSADEGWTTEGDGSMSRAFTTGYRVRAQKVTARD